MTKSGSEDSGRVGRAVLLSAASAPTLTVMGSGSAWAQATCLTDATPVLNANPITTTAAGAHGPLNVTGTTSTDGQHNHTTQITIPNPLPIGPPNLFDVSIPTTSAGAHSHTVTGTTEAVGNHTHDIPANSVVIGLNNSDSGASAAQAGTLLAVRMRRPTGRTQRRSAIRPTQRGLKLPPLVKTLGQTA